MIKAIIYDLDDTLYPEREFQISGFGAVAKFVNQNWSLRITSQEIAKISEKYRKKTFDKLIHKYKLPVPPKTLVKVYREHFPARIRLYKGGEKVLAKLSQAKYFLGIITGNPYKSQINKIKALRLKKYFHDIVYTDLLNAPKPADPAFQMMKRKARCKNKEIIYIGDNEKIDFLGARKSGYVTVKYLGKGFYSHLKLPKKYRADFEIRRHGEIFGLLNKLNRKKR